MLFRAVVMAVLVLGLAPSALAQGKSKPRPSRHGKLQVVVTVEGADVAIDGEQVGRTPLEAPLSLPAGTHTIKVSKPGHAEFLDTVKIGTNQTTRVEVDLLPFAAVVNVASLPPGADVLVDGKLVGQTPLRVEVEPGTRVVRLATDGFREAEQTIEATAGESYELDLRLVALPPPPAPSRRARPVYKTWWFWAATGVVAVGATALVISAGSDGDPLGGADRVIDVNW